MPVAYYISYINIKTEAKQMNTNVNIAIQKSAINKMAIVDGLSAKYRAIVHEIGLSDFSQKHKHAYRTAKKKAGLLGKSMRNTQRTETTKFINKAAA